MIGLIATHDSGLIATHVSGLITTPPVRQYKDAYSFISECRIRYVAFFYLQDLQESQIINKETKWKQKWGVPVRFSVDPLVTENILDSKEKVFKKKNFLPVYDLK